MALDDLFRESHRNLVSDNTSQVHADQKPTQPTLKNDLFTKIQLRFGDSEKAALEQIRAASKVVIDDIFSGLLTTVDEFYSSFRKPKVTDQGITVLDRRNRIVWATDDQGRYIDDYSNMSGQDIEVAILKIQRDKLDAASKVNELFLDALFAKHVFDDLWYQRYESLLDGTISDKTARANRDTKQDKYLAYFKFYTYQQSDVIFSEIANLLRLLERIRQWRVSSSYQERDGSRSG